VNFSGTALQLVNLARAQRRSIQNVAFYRYPYFEALNANAQRFVEQARPIDNKCIVFVPAPFVERFGVVVRSVSISIYAKQFVSGDYRAKNRRAIDACSENEICAAVLRPVVENTAARVCASALSLAVDERYDT